MKVVDFRSDTVTHPTQDMRRAMADAEVGDMGRGDDPSVNRLEEMSAQMLGKDAAMFVPSGTMGNLVSILTHTDQKGGEIIIGDRSHIFRSEYGGAAVLGGVSYHTLRNDHRGMLDPREVKEAIESRTNVPFPRPVMVALENTHNACGGAVLTQDDTKVIAEIAHSYEIPLHMDGARIFNAAVYLETSAKELVEEADSLSFCLSKGLSGPIGSLVCGSNEFIEKARYWRRMLGGEMRQAGVVAAAGIVALETMVDRLTDDHSNARKLAIGLSRIPNISIDLDNLPTNLVFFDITIGDPAELARKLSERGVKGGTPLRRWRFVAHYGITSDDVDYALNAIESTFRECAIG